MAISAQTNAIRLKIIMCSAHTHIHTSFQRRPSKLSRLACFWQTASPVQAKCMLCRLWEQ